MPQLHASSASSIPSSIHQPHQPLPVSSKASNRSAYRILRRGGRGGVPGGAADDGIGDGLRPKDGRGGGSLRRIDCARSRTARSSAVMPPVVCSHVGIVRERNYGTIMHVLTVVKHYRFQCLVALFNSHV